MALEDRTSPLVPAPALSSDAVTLLFRPLLISAMVGCIAGAWVAVARFFSPYWQGSYLVLATAILTLQTLVSEQLAQRLLPPAERLRVRLAEVALTALLLRPMMYLQRGLAALRTDAASWLRQPLAFFSDIEYLAGLLVMAGLWFVAQDISRALGNLGDPYARTEERHSELAHLSNRFVGGALFLLSAAAVVQLQLSPGPVLLRPAEKGAPTWLPLIYLALGTLLFGQARYALLRAKWQREEIPVAAELGRRWAKWGLLSVAAVCLLAIFLPAGTTELGLLLFLWLSYLTTALGAWLLFALQLLLYILLLPLLTLLGSEQAPTPLRPQLPPIPDLPPQVSSASPPWFMYLRLTLFRLAALAIVLWLLQQLLRHWRDVGIWATLGRRVRDWWRGLWRTLRKRWQSLHQQRSAPRTEDAHPAGAEVPLAGAPWWKRWRADTMRERVRRLYLLLLERAQRAGAGRAPHQTPYEYESNLAPRVSGDEKALRGLTEAFVEARYSQRDFGLQDVHLLRRLYNRLRSRLRQL